MADHKKYIIFIVIGIVIALALSYFVGGIGAVGNLISKILLFIVVIGSIAVVVIFVLWLFGKNKIDRLKIWKQMVIQSAVRSAPKNKQWLWLSGNESIGARPIGEIVGYVQEYATEKMIVGSDTLKPANPGKKERLYLIVVKGKGSFLSKNYDIIQARYEDLMGGEDAFAGDIVYLKGTQLAPKIFERYVLAHHWHDTTFLDWTASKDVYRYTLEGNLREIESFISMAVNVDAHHVKSKELSKYEEIGLPPLQR